MGKSPAFQFYPNDWSRDLEEHPLEIEGAWVRICCKLWWSEERGCLTKTLDEWARILRISPKKACEILNVIISKHISDGSYLDNQNITIICRRMVRDERIRKIRQEVGRLGGNPNLKKSSMNLDNQTDNQNPTPSSSSSSSTSKKERNKRKKVEPVTDETWLEELQKKDCYSYLNVKSELQKCQEYFKAKNKIVSKTRFLNWLNSPYQQKPITVQPAQKDKPKQAPSSGEIWLKELQGLKHLGDVS